jgi:hypothetical protein
VKKATILLDTLQAIWPEKEWLLALFEFVRDRSWKNALY